MNPGSTATPDRWQRMESIFHAALEIDESKRSDFIRRSCDGDDSLQQEVEQLLAAQRGAREYKAPREPRTPPKLLVFGEYRVDREIGEGGMGTVYLAHRVDGQFEQQVALKIMNAHLRSQFFAERFRTERQILAQLNHPNITRLLDGGMTAEGDPYLVMEYVEGRPIHEFSDQGRLSVPERIRLLLPVCAAVEYAHRNLIVHRDLKPANIFVTREGVPKLLDFGTAKLLLSDAANSSATRVGMMTPRYASPEQLRGEPITTVTDVYSLGVLLYELACGAWPFGDPESPITGFERAVKDIEPARPSAVITDEAARLRSTSKAKLARLVDGDLRSIIEKALQPSPQRRYQSVEQLAEDLKRYLEGGAVLARSQTAFYRIGRFVRRNWLPVTLAAVFVLGLSAATAIAIRQARAARAEATRAQAVTRFLQDVIYAGDPEDVKDRTVLQAMEIARERLKDVKDPQVELSIRVALGYVYMQNSLLPRAEKELRRAETLARGTGNDEMLAATLLSLSNVLFNESQVRAAIMEALDIVEKKGAALPPDLRVGVLIDAGQLLGIESPSPRAERILREAVQIARTNQVSKASFVGALSDFGQYLRYQNRLDEAVPLFQEVLARDAEHPAVSMHLALEELGAISMKRGQLADAERYFSERRELLMRLAGPTNGTTMDARSRWAALEARLGHVPEALREQRENMVFARKAFAPGSLGLWHPLTTLAYILNLAGQPAEAFTLAQDALACLGPTTNTDTRTASIQSEIGIALAEQRRYQEAVPRLEQALRIFSANSWFGPNDYRSLRIKGFLDQARTKLKRSAGEGS